MGNKSRTGTLKLGVSPGFVTSKYEAAGNPRRFDGRARPYFFVLSFFRVFVILLVNSWTGN